MRETKIQLETANGEMMEVTRPKGIEYALEGAKVLTEEDWKEYCRKIEKESL